MSKICYSWVKNCHSWVEAPFTWAEACLFETVGGLSPYRKERLRKDLTVKEKQTLITLFFRMNLDELVIEKKLSKTKSKKIKIRIKDVETLLSEADTSKILSITVKEETQPKKNIKIIIK